jgi:hypothetical protein
MKFLHTISAQDSKELDKKVSTFLNANPSAAVSYSSNVIPIQAQPVKGLELLQGAPQMQMNFLTFFFAFAVYEVEEPAKPLNP